MAKSARLPTLPFRRFLTYQDIDDFVKGLEAARPGLCRLGTLGKSREGRRIHLLTVTDFETGKPENRPGYLIHGNIHAGELAGAHASLYTARQLLADHRGSDLLKRVTFYIVPRINPDGAEFVVTTAGRVRSRSDRSEKRPNTLYQEDVDGDGLILTMRQDHPNGSLVADPSDPRLLIARRPGDPGPFYRVLPEGMIHDWDGSDRILEGGRGYDWNRNWSYDWRPEPEQYGAGDFPFSEPEMRCMAEFLHSRPNLFGVLGYHTGPAAVLRPPSTGSMTDIDERDDKMMEDLAGIGAEETGFPVVPVVKYRAARSRDINLRGHFHNFGYHHLGLFVFEFELGTIKDSARITTEEQFAVASEEDQEAQMRRLMKWCDRQRPRLELCRPWTPFDHPQLGAVEIGGFLFRQLANRTLSDLAEVVKRTYRFTLEHAQKHPSVVLEDVSVDTVGGPVYRVRARVANRGEFPTHVSNKGRTLRRLRPVRVEFHAARGVELLSAEGHTEVGHLAGVTGSRTLEWFVSAPKPGKGLCEIRVLGGTGGNASVKVGV